MKGTLKADKHFVTFEFDKVLLSMDILIHKYDSKRGCYWIMGFIGEESYMIDILSMDEARGMYE